MVTHKPDGTVEFCFYRPEAARVAIAGDFNDWQPCFAMGREADGWWRGQIRLGEGIYQFMYVADGQWYADYAAFGLECGPYGWNSVLRIEPVSTSDERETDGDLDRRAA